LDLIFNFNFLFNFYINIIYINKDPEQQIIGLVGYPNVGKSSTINAVTGAKKVAVGSTPGKTKHFQVLIIIYLYIYINLFNIILFNLI